MDNQNPYDDLLARYLLNDLNPGEEKQVIDWINSNEENARYFEKFKELFNLSNSAALLQNTNVDNEWAYHKRVVDGGEMIMNVPDEADELLFKARIRRRRRTNIFMMSGIAASLLLVIGAVILMSNPQKAIDAVSQTQPATPRTAKPDVRGDTYTETNSSETPRNLLLSDGSEIVLYANSEVIYQKEFTGNERRIQLKGKADFAVTKDSTKPFIVSSGDISTTVLGTKFTVTAYEGSVVASVRLYEGKVMVRSTSTASKKLDKDYILVPGQEIVYNKLSGEAFVRSFKSKKSPTGEQLVENIEMPEDFKGSWFMFNNQPLPDVLDQLEALYDVEINYKRADLDKMYFIGRFDQTDSINEILKKISLLYQLKISNHNNKYSIAK